MIEKSDLGVGYNISRQIVLIHETIEYTCKLTLEHKYIAAIIINTKLAFLKNVTIISHY